MWGKFPMETRRTRYQLGLVPLLFVCYRSQIGLHCRYRNTYPTVISLLERGLVDVKPLITHRFYPFEQSQLDAAFQVRSCVSYIIASVKKPELLHTQKNHVVMSVRDTIDVFKFTTLSTADGDVLTSFRPSNGQTPLHRASDPRHIHNRSYFS